MSISVVLSWMAPTHLSDGNPIPPGELVTYNIYRGNRSDGSDLILLNVSPITALTYIDATAALDRVYYYVARAVRTSIGVESAKSNTAVADSHPTSSPSSLMTNL